MFSTNSTSYINSLDHNLKLFTFYQSPERKADGKKDIVVPSWKNDDDLKVRLNGSDNGLAVKLGKQFDGSYLYCLDFDTSYEEAATVHMDKFDRSNVCFYLESTLNGGHILLRSDSKIELIDRKQIVLKEADGHAICEILGEGQCVFIAPSPEKEHRFGDLNQIFASHVIEQFVQETADRYGFSFDSLKKTTPVKPSDTASRTTSDPLSSPLDYFNTNIQLIQFKLDEEGYQLMGENELGFLYKRPDRTPDGDASIILFSERTERTCYVIHTFSHHMATFNGDNCASKFFELEHDIASSDMVKWVCENSDYDQRVREKTMSSLPVLEAPKKKETKKTDKIDFDNFDESFFSQFTVNDLLCYYQQNAVTQAPASCFYNTPVFQYARSNNARKDKSQLNGALAASLTAVAAVVGRCFYACHLDSDIRDTPVAHALFMQETGDGKSFVKTMRNSIMAVRNETLLNAYKAVCGSDTPLPLSTSFLVGSIRSQFKEVTRSEDGAVRLQYDAIKLLGSIGESNRSGVSWKNSLLIAGRCDWCIDEAETMLGARGKSNAQEIVDAFSNVVRQSVDICQQKTVSDGQTVCGDNNPVADYPHMTSYLCSVPADIKKTFVNQKEQTCGTLGRIALYLGQSYKTDKPLTFDQILEDARVKTRAFVEADENNELGMPLAVKDWIKAWSTFYVNLQLENAVIGYEFKGEKKREFISFENIELPRVLVDNDANVWLRAISVWFSQSINNDSISDIFQRYSQRLSTYACICAASRYTPDSEDCANGTLKLHIEKRDVLQAARILCWEAVQLGALFFDTSTTGLDEKEERVLRLIEKEFPEGCTQQELKDAKKADGTKWCDLPSKKAFGDWHKKLVEQGFFKEVGQRTGNGRPAAVYAVVLD